jgi:hypothetical protein
MWKGELTRKAEALLAECNRIATSDSLSKHRSLGSLYRDAESLREQGYLHEYGLLLVSLVDLGRAKGLLGPALKFAEQAESIYASLSEARYRHNHGVTLYSSGLVHQLLGSDKEAWDCYSRALEAFEEAEKEINTLPTANEEVTFCEDKCKVLIPWVELLMDYVCNARALGCSSAVRYPILLGLWPSGNDSPQVDQLLMDVSVREIGVDMHLRSGHREYKLAPVKGKFGVLPTIQLDKEHYVLEIPQELEVIAPFRDAKYALVRREVHENRYGVGAEVTKDDQILWGMFTRDPQKGVVFTVIFEDGILAKPKFVGEDDLVSETKGCIIGVFKEVS